MNTTQIVLASRPTGMPTQENFRSETITLPDLQPAEVMVQGLYYSVDPYMRGRMNEGKSYVPPFKIDCPLEGGVIGKVITSRSDQFKKGDIVIGNLPWQEACVVADNKIKPLHATVSPISFYLSVLGMTGLTAYLGLMQIGVPKAGETVVVSGAGGAVGIVVGQIAKLKECHVIGISGSEEKANLLKAQFGFDEVINYKTTSKMSEAVRAACPKGVDIYFDNVGGELSDAVMSCINKHARIPLCGQISLYNTTQIPVGPRVQPLLLTRSSLMQGFIVSDYETLFPEASTQLTKWLAEGKLKFTDTIVHGFPQLPAALLGLFTGENTGKMVVRA
jgi:NADPH:quinone reductase